MNWLFKVNKGTRGIKRTALENLSTALSMTVLPHYMLVREDIGLEVSAAVGEREIEVEHGV